jgi:glycosyltransferase involved in cell wall biosynthesis
MRVLLLADHCNPKMASTPYFGYQIARAISRRVEYVALATQVRNRGAYTAEEAGVSEIEYIDSEYVAKPIHRLASWIKGDPNKAMTVGVALSYPSNIAFEREVWKVFGPRLERGEFDVVHRVTPLSPTTASPMAKWSPVPFVVGPVNGGLRWPKEFAAEMSREREHLTRVRSLYKILPYYRSTYTKAGAVLAGFSHTRADLPVPDAANVFDCPDVGFEDSGEEGPADRPPSERMTVLFAGRFVPYKCADVVVRAFAASPLLRQHKLVLVGDGPDRGLIEQLIRENGLESCVEVTGFVPHAEVMKRMREADVFAFPSIRELGAGVVIEAMGLGMACVVVDYGAPGFYVKSGRGIAVPLVDKPGLVESFRDRLEWLANSPRERVELGARARQYARANHTWDAKAENIVRVYEWALGRTKERPDFYGAALNPENLVRS